MLISDGINHGKLQSIIVGELKKAGLKHRLKKYILKNVKDNKTVFGSPLVKVPSCSVICCGSTLSVPVIVTEMSSVLRTNAHIEGLFRKAGSQARQKDIKRLLDAGGCVSEGHHPIDVASVLKLYLRCLPEPLISAELLSYIASKHKDNLMDSSNLAIVMTPSIMPLPAAASAQRLEHHVALVKMFIENAKHIGLLTEDLMMQLDDDPDAYTARRKKRRSGSLNRMLSGLRKMVSGNVNTPATVRENGKTPILSKSASKRKYESYEGLSAKVRKEITKGLPQKELSFTPMKMGLERKRLRLSLMDARSTPIINADFSSHKNSETSISSEDLLTSSEHLFSAHDTIDLSPDMKQQNKDYVRISKQEYEEIKSRVSAIENRLSREFTDVIPRVQPLQQVQNVYEQTLEEVAMLNCGNSDHLARRLSKELKIRPTEEAKIIRSPSARKIGSIRRRSRENLTKIVRHKSWNVSSHSQASHIADRFYPYVGLNRQRTNTAKPDLAAPKVTVSEWDGSASENSMNNVSDSSQKYRQRKRTSLALDYGHQKPVSRIPARRSLGVINHSFDNTTSDTSMSNTLNSSEKSTNSDQKQHYQNLVNKNLNKYGKQSTTHQKWRSAAAFFMDKTGEVENMGPTGRPSVNKLRKQNAGAVMAKAKLFESSSDKSSERNDKNTHNGFARRPRVSGQQPNRAQKLVGLVKPKVQNENMHGIPVRHPRNVAEVTPISKTSYNNDIDWRSNRKTTPPIKRVVSPQSNTNVTPTRTPQIPTLKKSLIAPKTARILAPNNDFKKAHTPLKAIHVSPRRRSPRQKLQRASIQGN
ncbi:hypothetical protein O3G_MSEX009229 [Manduca sexta]|uniref:Rho-GAP domain-containing protein n=1 Tax=Manduca sexta TaxID=7130 RepID=A0A921ZD95_MANSE|nr:hypothetical protein O3G_MSEX009229 [Manduca sexta]